MKESHGHIPAWLGAQAIIIVGAALYLWGICGLTGVYTAYCAPFKGIERDFPFIVAKGFLVFFAVMAVHPWKFGIVCFMYVVFLTIISKWTRRHVWLYASFLGLLSIFMLAMLAFLTGYEIARARVVRIEQFYAGKTVDPRTPYVTVRYSPTAAAIPDSVHGFQISTSGDYVVIRSSEGLVAIPHACVVSVRALPPGGPGGH